ncbi:hypothetical protein CHS0354_012088 [Potamilus streckersoni]|uniref:Methylmalonic aciduria and homocystinuria type D protein n=1 Tax=Potamilus streckersoni TaxID=2493646 RepID=A0AAE0SA31_9BIVA|nr:hypothetical protein CHS0354_012088 [Potamilus streckersoni]
MATRLLSSKGRIVCYLPNLRAFVGHFRSFSAYQNDNATVYYSEDSSNSDFPTVWPDKNLGPFGPQDRRFPLPGLIGPSSYMAELTQKTQNAREPVSPDLLFQQLPSERQGSVLNQVLNTIESIEQQYCSDKTTLSPSDILECTAEECPQLLRKDLSNLFPDRNIMSGDFTVITVSQKTLNDMTSWSEAVALEREELLASFVQGAGEICEALRAAGFWADFIDPSSGKPYLGECTSDTLFETDERYRKLGFEIEDLGCCKVIRHHLWGTHAYVGCLFTNAPVDHPVLLAMQKT